MKKLLQVLAVAAPAALAFAVPVAVVSVSAPAVAADAQAEVKKGLRIMNQVVAHTARLVAAKDYGHIAHEHEEVIEAKEILDESLSADQKAKAGGAIDKAVAASTALKDVSAAKDDAKTQAAHAAFAAAVKDVLALFPADMQPPPPKN